MRHDDAFGPRSPLTRAGDADPAQPPGKHVWVELIAFDCQLDDLGVAAYLNDLQDPPDVVSLLLYSAEFLHSHREDGDPRARIPVECTAYGARPIGIRGPRQDWTRSQLTALVQGLQAHGIRVYFAVFDLHRYEHEGRQHLGRWNVRHPEMSPIDADGQRWDGLINPLRRLADGTLYEDFLAGRLAAALADYGFDGLHGADGFSSGRLPLWRADFGDDIIEQFTQHTGIVLPPELRGACDHNPAQVADRARWIWAEAKMPWITFHVERWTQFWRKLVTAAHERGAVVVLNNAWTRDPFEALYRYGVDYAKLIEAGVDGMVLETSASAIDLLERPARDPIHGMLAGTLLIRAHLPDLPIAALIPVHDTYEKWDVIHHAPAALERDVRTLTAMSSIPAGGSRPRRCFDALLMCLADGLSAQDWRRLDDLRASCHPAQSWGGGGVTVLYAPEVLGDELRRFAQSRVAPTHAIVTSLLRAGANITSIARPHDHARLSGPVLLVHPDLYDPAALRDLRDQHPDATLIGRGDGEPAEWRAERSERGSVVESVTAHEPLPDADDGESATHSSWLIDLPMRQPAPDFFSRTARLLEARTDPRDGIDERALDEAWVQIFTTAESSTTRRVLFVNGDAHYRDASVTLTRDGVSARALSMFPATPVRLRGRTLSVRVPPKGVVEVTLTD